MFRFRYTLPLRGPPFFALVAFIFALSSATISPIFPLFIKSFVGQEAYVGYVLSFFALVLIASSFIVGTILRNYCRLTLIKISLFSMTIIYFLLTAVTNFYQFLPIEFFRVFFVTAIWLSISLLIRDHTTKKKLGKTEGMFFTFLNLAWLIGPLFGGLIAKNYGFDMVFVLAAIFCLVSTYTSLTIKRENKLIQPATYNISTNIRDYFKSKNLSLIYIVTAGIPFLWTLVYIFLPLFIIKQGLAEDMVGYALFLIVIPLLILEFPIGKLADKFGFKKFLFLGYVIIAFAMFLTYFFNSPFAIMAIFVFASVGAAFLEPLVEGYFFEVIPQREELRFYPVFTTSKEIAHLISPAIFSTILLYTNFKITFVSSALFFIVFAIATVFLKNNRVRT